MSQQYNLWLEYPGDWHDLRTFFFGACHCTGFATGPTTLRAGLPDPSVPVNNIYNEYNLIDFHPKFTGRRYKNDVEVTFTLNKPLKWAEWEREVIGAAIRWLAHAGPGDALLDWDGLAIIGRKGTGPIIVNDFSQGQLTSRGEHARGIEYQNFIAETLKAQGLASVSGPLDPI